MIDITNLTPLFYAHIELPKHSIKKNGKAIRFRNKRTLGRFGFKNSKVPFIASTADQKFAENFLVSQLQKRARDISFDKPLSDTLWCVFRFFYPKEKLITKKNKFSLTSGDLSNLYESPQDSLQKAGIIENDALIKAHDLSGTFVSDKYSLEIIILPYEESPSWKLKNLFSSSIQS